MLIMLQPRHRFLQFCQVMVVITFLSSVALVASNQLHPEEVKALKQIVETLTHGGQPLNLGDDPCQSGTTKYTEPNSDANGTIICNCTVSNDRYCRITILSLKTFSLPGTLPPEMSKLEYLEILDLTRNYISGNIPKEWALMKHLTQLSLTANRLSGKIPVYLGSFRNLTYLSLEANQFSGTIPDRLGDLVNLKNLTLSSNQLEGPLPKTLAALGFYDFRVSDNNLSGSIPDFIGNWSNLERLELYASGLEGPIPPAIFSLEKLNDLVLRNVSLTGVIPGDVWTLDSNLKMLDLSFNKLEGKIPQDARIRKFMFLSGNMLTGNVPDSLIQKGKFLDVSYNNFSWKQSCEYKQNINMYKSSSINNLSGLLPCSGISKCSKSYRSFHVNCGGQDVTNRRISYEGDEGGDGVATIYYKKGSNWGFSSTGDFMDDNDERGNKYTLDSKSNLSMDSNGLYSTARRAAISLTYFGYCLQNGIYTVTLHFTEIQFTDDKLYNRVGKRFFDIYIQGKREIKDFNIQKAANGSNKPFPIKVNTNVTDHSLEIRLYWTGKGTTCIPSRGNYGPLISAISVCSGMCIYI